MKKLFIVLAVASLGFVACNNESETETNADTAATIAPDTTTVAPTVQDSTVVADTTAKADSTNK